MKQLTCLIAEDSSVERDGLRFLIESRQYPVRVLEASDGEKALAVTEKEPVDILFTDIRMPFMDGLELAREIRKRGNNMRIFICSAYGEFSYAKRAIEYGVSGYLLKPVQRAEFYRQFEQVLSELEIEDDYKALERLEREKCWYDLTHGRRVDEEIRARLARHGVSADSVKPVLMLLQFSLGELEHNAYTLNQSLSNCTDGLWAIDMSRAMVLVESERRLNESELSQMVYRIQDKAALNRTKPAVLMAQPAAGAEGLSAAWQQLEEQSELRLYAQGSINIIYSESTEDDSEQFERLYRLLDAADLAMEKQNPADAYERLSEFVACARLCGNVSALYMRYAAMKALTVISKSESNCESVKVLLDEMSSAHTTEQIISFVEVRLPVLLPQSANQSERGAIDSILQVINERYMEPLTLDSLASEVHFAPSYISTLFRKKTGTTLIKYLTNFRMKRAAEMLLEGDKPVTEIAQDVGYNNMSYFSLLFKTQYGLSPIQFRRTRRTGDTL